VPVLRRGAPLVALGAAMVALPGRRYGRSLAAVPVLASWLLAPVYVAWLDRPHLAVVRPLSADDQVLLRRLARTTWAFRGWSNDPVRDPLGEARGLPCGK
jgi:hypothetical protein